MGLGALNRFLQHTQLDDSASMIERARQVAVQAHISQTRWNGNAYVTHPMRVAASLLRPDTISTEDEQVVALLHDVVEDTDVIFPQLREFGFSEQQVDAVDSVTKRRNESYTDFVLRSKKNPIGRVVKIADIKDNLRDLNSTKMHRTMRDKYELALCILEN